MTKIPPRLSDQQKFILAFVENNTEQDYIYDFYCRSQSIAIVSRAVAGEFNKEHRDRINWGKERKKGREEELERVEKKLKNDYTEEKKIRYRLMSLTHQRDDYEDRLTPKHRASFSRALKNLDKKRGLLRVLSKDRKLIVDKEDLEEVLYDRAIILTSKGHEVAQEILHRINDKRYNLNFSKL